ncbi:response regulator transcription factor [Streptomyces sp. G3]|uniref:Response regulator transcription factor n=1 Tax=Streptomyces salinarius TaxID=2762598 RepID=A0ABW8BP19_9ACTN|nr:MULTISPECIES: response regulator transcription factor [Streptomyces]WSU00725.1 response regulator transcription factor [Streptomyces sp. NBC_01124]AZM74994.1 DNA-binding response regulator [Streptomyces sp. KPB2]MBH5135544.1 response regulator transcription factor [Streptomyces sp. HB-N217]MCM1936638.1 response regulator transcription factor [Streptomyces sp. G3]MDU0256831.1 response regulator transcription factor [Streptomyces sp. PU10]
MAAPTPPSRPAGRTDHLLVVDDEPTVRELLRTALRYAGFDVDAAATGREALDLAALRTPDLVLLDVMLPDMDGFEVIRRLRAQPRSPRPGRGGDVPVLFVTAREDRRDRLHGLRLGGDDYVTKPFDLEELIARIHAVLRRTRGETPARLTVGDLHLEPDSHHVTRAGRTVRLSPTEFRLLHFLVANAGRTMTKSQILDSVWEYDFGGDPSIVDTYISYLRRKVDPADADGPRLIHTVRGVGYVVREPRP